MSKVLVVFDLTAPDVSDQGRAAFPIASAQVANGERVQQQFSLVEPGGVYGREQDPQARVKAVIVVTRAGTGMAGPFIQDQVNAARPTIRMQKAAQLLEQKWGPIAQVAYEVGISNLSYFSKIFKEEFGTLPSEYEKQS